jgi:hypothetical protein
MRISDRLVQVFFPDSVAHIILGSSNVRTLELIRAIRVMTRDVIAEAHRRELHEFDRAPKVDDDSQVLVSQVEPGEIMSHETINSLIAAYAALVGTFSLAASIVAIVRTSAASAKTNEITAKNLEIAASALKLSQAQVEIDVRARITQATRDLHEFSAKYGALLAKAKSNPSGMTIDERDHLVLAKEAAKSVTEEYLNAYDEACQKYRDDKIDKKRFKKSYVNQVREIGEDKEYHEILKLGHRYAAFNAVFDEWENHEKD